MTYYANGATRDATIMEKHDPEFVAMPRYWVAKADVEASLAGHDSRAWFLGWRNVSKSQNERTTIAAVFPRAAVGNSLPLMLTRAEASKSACLLACLTSFAQDFFARLKVGGVNLNFFFVEQFPILAPRAYDQPAAWDPAISLEAWARPRVLELTYSAWDMIGFARDLGDDGPPFQWDEERRRTIPAELDAAYFHLYGFERDGWITSWSPFPIVQRKERAAELR